MTGPEWEEFSLFKPYRSRLMTGVTLRSGGESQIREGTLNLALHVNDDPALVWKNRRALMKRIVGKDIPWITADQVHGTEIFRADKELDLGFNPPAVPKTDALITNTPGRLLALFFADCVPVVLYDPVNHAGGICHAGWRGTAEDIAGRTVSALVDAYGSNPDDLIAAVGPAIGPCCFTIGEDTAKMLTDSVNNGEELLARTPEGVTFDLKGANARQLYKAGLNPRNIETSRLCTCCRTDRLFSHRKEMGRTGRHGLFFYMKEIKE